MTEFQEHLKEIMDEYVHLIYKNTKNFPNDELYGVVSQLRRASLSIILNYIEGYARKKTLVRLNFFEIAYGSLQETKYLLKFSLVESYLSETDYSILKKLSEEIGAMLWKEILNLENIKKTKSS